MKIYDALWFLGGLSGCHRIPERSFFLNGKQFPVCARCTGCFVGYAVGLAAAIMTVFPVEISIVLLSVMLFDWLLQENAIAESTNVRRLLTGIAGGCGYIQLLLKVLIGSVMLLKNFI